MTRVPQVLESVKLPSKKPIDKMPKLTQAMSSATKRLGTKGRILVRWSGTEAKLRLMAEGPNSDTLSKLVQDMTDAAKRDLSASA